jgi:hypothetical protein
MLAGVLIGAGVAILYSMLVAVVHFAVHWRWDRSHILAAAFVVAGSVLGMTTAWAYSGPGRRQRRASRVTIRACHPNRMTLALAA